MAARRRIYHLLFPVGERRGLRGGFDAALLILILLSTLAVILESVESLETRYRWWFKGFEIFSTLAFSVEYLLRLWACVEDARYRHPLWGDCATWSPSWRLSICWRFCLSTLPL